MIDLRTREVRPTRAAIEELIEWVQPVADELGTAEYLSDPGGERGRTPDRALRGGRVAGGDLRRAGAALDGAGQWLRASKPPKS